MSETIYDQNLYLMFVVLVFVNTENHLQCAKYVDVKSKDSHFFCTFAQKKTMFKCV